MKNNLKLYRTKSGYTQEDISKELDCRLDDLFFLES
jgi:DNA-binding XRE family transcriptional regulator